MSILFITIVSCMGTNKVVVVVVVVVVVIVSLQYWY